MGWGGLVGVGTGLVFKADTHHWSSVGVKLTVVRCGVWVKEMAHHTKLGLARAGKL